MCTLLALAISPHRHIIRYMKQLFFNRETWSECNEEIFMAQAHTCSIESLKNIHDLTDGTVAMFLVCLYW